MRLVGGIDGGASSTTLSIFGEDGTEVSRVSGGPSNPHVKGHKATATDIIKLVRQGLESARLALEAKERRASDERGATSGLDQAVHLVALGLSMSGMEQPVSWAFDFLLGRGCRYRIFTIRLMQRCLGSIADRTTAISHTHPEYIPRMLHVDVKQTN